MKPIVRNALLFAIACSSRLSADASGLTLAITHVGNFSQGQANAAYTLTVTNGSTLFTGLATLVDTLPSGFTLVSMAGKGWDCSGTSCTRADRLAPGASYPPVQLLVNVSAGATSPQVNTASVTISGPLVTNASDSTVVLPAFTDVTSADFYFDAVNLLRQYGITSGCATAPPAYCPGVNATRAQMAIFIVRSVMGGDTFSYSSTPYFSDVAPSDFGFQWIQKMYELGITTGCSVGKYCPADPVTRGQMAVFVIRARLGASADSAFTYPATPSFTDVPSSHVFFKWIQRMKKDSITSGCTVSTYCPDDAVTRGQMALFIMRGGFNQLLPAGTPVLTSIAPATGAPGATVNVSVTGANTNFATGLTALSLGQGVTATNVTAMDSTTLTAQLAIDAAATAGPRTVLATTNTEEALLPNGFRIPFVSVITIQNFAFAPNPDNVANGSLLSWTNKDSVTHRIVSDTAGVFDTQNMTQNQTVTINAPASGTYTYHCTIHPFMTGTVVVQ